jgi:hypothetical protein
MGVASEKSLAKLAIKLGFTINLVLGFIFLSALVLPFQPPIDDSVDQGSASLIV